MPLPPPPSPPRWFGVFWFFFHAKGLLGTARAEAGGQPEQPPAPVCELPKGANKPIPSGAAGLRRGGPRGDLGATSEARGGGRWCSGAARRSPTPRPPSPRAPPRWPVLGAAGPYREEGALRCGAPGGAASFGARGKHPPKHTLPPPPPPPSSPASTAAPPAPKGRWPEKLCAIPGSPRKLMLRLKSLLLSLSITIGAFISVPDPGCVTSSVQL